MKTFILALFVLWLSAGAAFAQKTCDQFRSNITTASMSRTEKVAAIPNKRIYLCGYVIVRASGSADLEFELSTGTGRDCVTNNVLIIPRMDVPANGLVNRIPYAAGEVTPPGNAMCLQTWGAGSVTSIFYWAQF